VAVAPQGAATATLTLLPLPLSQRIFLLLPLDERARAALVCRAWCALLSEVSLWTRLDLSRASGLAHCVHITDAFLRGAAAKACGGLTALDVSGSPHVSCAALLEVLRRNAGALRTLRMGSDGAEVQRVVPLSNIEQLLSAAPAFDLHADVLVDYGTREEDALRKEPPFARLHIRMLFLDHSRAADEALVVRLADAMASYTSLTGVSLSGAPLGTAAALDAVVDAALARNMSVVELNQCSLSSTASAPALARLIQGGALTALRIHDQRLPDEPAAALVGEALRGNCSVRHLWLSCAEWQDAGAAVALLRAVTGHPSLQELHLDGLGQAEHAAAGLGVALGALVAADAPALHTLELGRLGDDALRPLFHALRANTHLRTLTFCGYRLSEWCVRDTLLPAVRANASLRRLHTGSARDARTVTAALRLEAEALVAARAAAADA
jgi:hypothetical protein